MHFTSTVKPLSNLNYFSLLFLYLNNVSSGKKYKYIAKRCHIDKRIFSMSNIQKETFTWFYRKSFEDAQLNVCIKYLKNEKPIAQILRNHKRKVLETF